MARARLPSASARDPLAEALHLVRLTGVLYCQAELSAPWGITVPDLDGCLSFQVVTQGRYLLELEGEAPRWLERGSVTLIPDGRPHRLRSARRVRLTALDDLPVVPVTDCYETLRFGGGGETARVIYGVLRFDRIGAQRLLSVLPPVLHVDGFSADLTHELIRLLTREVGSLQVGGEVMVTRLADILVIQVIRSWLGSAPEAQQGWVAALRDVQIGRALGAIHRAPERPWTLALLAKEAGMSRSAFSARFSKLVGESAMHYVTSWRMQLARAHLQQTHDTLAETAGRFGYSTEAAFCKAFKRAFGVTPASVRP